MSRHAMTVSLLWDPSTCCSADSSIVGELGSLGFFTRTCAGYIGMSRIACHLKVS